MLEVVVAKGGYWIIIALMMTGLYIVFAASNLIKRMVGLSIFQTSVFLFYITLSKVAGGTAPILYGKDYPVKKSEKPEAAPDVSMDPGGAPVPQGSVTEANPIAGADSYADYPGVQEVYSNPLPHVLILTAIVVGVATLSVGLAIVVRIRESYGTIEADEIRAMDIVVATAEENEDKAPADEPLAPARAGA
ncbi:MAG: cation:proton antiporter subunit C [Pseudomonadota bacterium]